MLKITLITLILLSVISSGCQVHAEAAVKTDALWQVSLINALMQGDYDGTVSVGDLLMIGDTGIGTFDHLDGEMIMLDGVVYKAKADGSVDIQPDQETVPFAAVTFFDNDIAQRDIAGLGSIDAMKAYLDDLVSQETGDYNRFYVAVIEGKFNSVHVRSVPEQIKPRPRLLWLWWWLPSQVSMFFLSMGLWCSGQSCLSGWLLLSVCF